MSVLKKRKPVLGVLALDASRSTGWAIRDTRGHIESGVETFEPVRGESPGMVFLRFRRWLNTLLDSVEGGIAVIAYEQAHHRGGHSTAIGVGLVTRIQEIAAEREIDLQPIHTGTLKKEIAGSGKADKLDMVKIAMQTYPDQYMPGTLNVQILKAALKRAYKARLDGTKKAKYEGMLPKGSDDQADALCIMKWITGRV